MPRFSALPPTPALEAEVRAWWRDEKIFERSLESPAPRGEWVFYEGPPTANGMPHNGHVLTRAIKDLFPRYRTMRGWRVHRKGGWDTHGLPVEVEVEKILGIHGRAAIEAHGLESFNRACIENVFTYTREWEDLTERIGFWLDQDQAYVTYHRSYVESVWWALSRLFAKGLLYQDYKVVWWWPQGGTALSSGEVGEGYRTVDDPSVTARFRVVGEPGVSFLAWTTTPWTLPSNVALAVGADLDYALVQQGDEQLWCADALRESVGLDGPVLRVAKGAELVGLPYEPLFTFHDAIPAQRALLDSGKHHVVVAGAHVSLGAGTGIVHTAPAFGEDDFQLRKSAGLGFLQLVGPDGKFLDGCGPYAGRFVKECDKELTRELKERGAVFKAETVRHEYPFCPRAENDPLIQYARPGWFIRTTAVKDQALANNAAVNWIPATIRDGRFGDFLRNNVDWALSRERYWGTPLNIWVCPACDARVAPANGAEIEALGGILAAGVSPDLQVHKPWIDGVTLPCVACLANGTESTMHRVPEVIDCWFDSGCMPFAQWGFPHRGHEEFARSFPADFISEAVDQTRGWFYSLLMVGTLLFDDDTCRELGLEPVGFPRPYKSVVVLGHVCDVDGKKESKSKGNYTSPDLVLQGRMKVRVVADATLQPGEVAFKPAQVKSLGLDPSERLVDAAGRPYAVVGRAVKGKDTVAMHPSSAALYAPANVVELRPPYPPPGADAFRWLFFASNPPWNNTRISLKAILEGQREFLLRLENVHRFFVLNAGDHDPAPPRAVHPLDRWILDALGRLLREITSDLDEYRLYESARKLSSFVDALSNWWLRRSRDRFDAEDAAEARDARDTLYAVLVTLAKAIAPFVPYLAEGIHRSLRIEGPESVHLCAWPSPEVLPVDDDLAAAMALVRELASLGLAARGQVGVRVRQPLRAAEIVLADAAMGPRIERLLPLLADELNVQGVHLGADANRLVTFKVKPDFRALGRRLGKDMRACQEALATLDGAEARARLLAGGLEVDLPSGRVTLGPAEVQVEVSPREGFQAAGSAAAVVALEATIDAELKELGYRRDCLARVQGLRKKLQLPFGAPVRARVLRAGSAEWLQAEARAEFRDAARAELGGGDFEPEAEERFDLDGVVFEVAVARMAP